MRLACPEPIPSTSKSCNVFKKFPSDIICFAVFHDTSFIPFNMTMHSAVNCTGFGGLEKVLQANATNFQILNTTKTANANVY